MCVARYLPKTQKQQPASLESLSLSFSNCCQYAFCFFLLHIMAFRTPTYWKSMVSRLGGGGRSTFVTSTPPKMKAHSPALDFGHVQDHTKPRPVKGGDIVPVSVAMGMIMMSVSLGLYTAMHQLKRAPNVLLRKSRRETIPEVEEPDVVVDEADKFIKKSLLRKVAHIQDSDRPTVPDNIRGEVLARKPRAETLKSVGVDPKKIA